MRHSSFCFFILFITIFSAPSCERYVNHPDWNPDAKKALNSFIRSERNQKERPYVVFDFDNTCSIFDVSVQLMAYQLETMCFNLDPEEFSIMANTGMETYPESLQESLRSIIDDYTDLYSRYGPFTAKGVDFDTQAKMGMDPVWKDFASDMGLMYEKLQEYMTADDAYLWTMGWFSGMSGKEVYQMAYRSHEKYSKIPTAFRSLKGSHGTYSWIDGIAVADNIRELWKALYDNGFDICVCSDFMTIAKEFSP